MYLSLNVHIVHYTCIWSYPFDINLLMTNSWNVYKNKFAAFTMNYN